MDWTELNRGQNSEGLALLVFNVPMYAKKWVVAKVDEYGKAWYYTSRDTEKEARQAGAAIGNFYYVCCKRWD